ncbi:nuclear transport factor 2 family protein [Rhodococcus sp. Rp3]|uniref:nuclear transport factor 2 family protein n=1 Tax=Rhodococcus sp. Rp3 TaxID=2807635 RepID=UPI003FA76813
MCAIVSVPGPAGTVRCREQPDREPRRRTARRSPQVARTYDVAGFCNWSPVEVGYMRLPWPVLLGEVVARRTLGAELPLPLATRSVGAALRRSVFWSEAWCSYGDYEGGPDGFVEFAQSALHRFTRIVHLLGCACFEVDGENEYGEVYAQSRHYWTDRHGHNKPLTVSGRYVDQSSRRNSQWRIMRRREVCDISTVQIVQDGQLLLGSTTVGSRPGHGPRTTALPTARTTRLKPRSYENPPEKPYVAHPCPGETAAYWYGLSPAIQPPP